MNALWLAYKDYVHQVGVAVALFLILTTGLIVEGRLLLGRDFPTGYDTWIWALVSLVLGTAVGGTAALRATSIPYVAAKAAAKANGGAPQVSVAGDVTVQTAATAEHQAPIAVRPV